MEEACIGQTLVESADAIDDVPVRETSNKVHSANPAAAGFFILGRITPAERTRDRGGPHRVPAPFAKRMAPS